jgi:hypothetical protein
MERQHIWGRHMNEHTLIKTVQLPCGQRWAWYADANIIGLSPDLTCEEDRQGAIGEAVAFWRRNLIKVVPMVHA